MIWLSSLLVISHAEEILSSQHVVAELMAMNRGRRTPKKIPCSENCQSWDLSHPDTFNHFWLRDTEWLATANRYGVGTQLLPDETENIKGRLLEWTEPNRVLYAYVQNQQPQSYYWTWDRSIVLPTSSPFQVDRLQGIHDSVESILSSCKEQSVLQSDHRGNEYAWMGKDCEHWTVWVEYHPSSQNSLRVLGMRE